MAVVARADSPFDLKSTALSGLALSLRTNDLEVLAAAMAERFGADPGVFSHEPVVIDFSGLADGSADEVDFPALIGLLKRHHLLPAGVRGGTGSLLRAALAAGLGDVAGDPSSATAVRTGSNATAMASPTPAALADEVVESDIGTHSAASASPSTAGAPTLIVDKPLRSGQQVYAKGGDLVVLATVNVGAEVIADGSIHVYGPLRGKAVAGAKGNVDARIFSTCMEPQLLAIAGTYRTTENPLPAAVLGKPAQIRLDGERLVFEPLT